MTQTQPHPTPNPPNPFATAATQLEQGVSAALSGAGSTQKAATLSAQTGGFPWESQQFASQWDLPQGFSQTGDGWGTGINLGTGTGSKVVMNEKQQAEALRAIAYKFGLSGGIIGPMSLQQLRTMVMSNMSTIQLSNNARPNLDKVDTTTTPGFYRLITGLTPSNHMSEDAQWTGIISALGGGELSTTRSGDNFQQGTVQDAMLLLHEFSPEDIVLVKKMLIADQYITPSMLISGSGAGGKYAGATFVSNGGTTIDNITKGAWGAMVQSYIQQAAQMGPNAPSLMQWVRSNIVNADAVLTSHGYNIDNGVKDPLENLYHQVLGKAGLLPTESLLTQEGAFGPVRTQFQQMLGRDATPEELAQFTSTYDENQKTNSKEAAVTAAQTGQAAPMNIDYETGATMYGKTPRTSSAAAEFAASNSAEYQAHNMDNAMQALAAMFGHTAT
jgi:hypothetical protein